ncbi:MAG: hypothetical protein IJL25_07485, partial [Clostridia bacterium]|nr:hypothetical protein [Clostridia bacterium]
ERISHLRSKYIASPSGDISQQARQRDKLRFSLLCNHCNHKKTYIPKMPVYMFKKCGYSGYIFKETLPYKKKPPLRGGYKSSYIP